MVGLPELLGAFDGVFVAGGVRVGVGKGVRELLGVLDGVRVGVGVADEV